MRTAPKYRNWTLQHTSLVRSVVGTLGGLAMCTGVVLRLSSSGVGGVDLWLNILILAFGIWITISFLSGVVTLSRFPQLRGVDLPRRPVSRRAVRISTLALIVVASATVSSGVIWWLTDDWTPWAAIFGAGALLTVGAFFDRYLLLNRARNEALLASGTQPAGLESITPAGRVGSRPPDDTAADG